MKVGYYPGCSLEGTAKPYDLSSRAVCRALGLELGEVPDWVCCGSSPALKTNHRLSVSLAVQNLILAYSLDLADLLVPCPFCFRRLVGARDELRDDPALREEIQNVLKAALPEGLHLHNLLGFLHREVGLAKLRETAVRQLTGLKVAPYYGCYLVKPPAVTHFDHPERPVTMDEVIETAGVEVLDWDFKTECCGAGLALSKTDKVRELCGRIVKEAVWRGAEAIVVPCQLCQSNLDLRQKEIAKKEGRDYHLPVLYFTEILGLAFGLSPADLGLYYHFIDPIPMLKRKGFIE